MEFPLENLNGLLLPLAALTVISGLVGLVIGMLWRRSKAGEMEEKAQKRAQRLFKEMEVQRRAELLEEKRKVARRAGGPGRGNQQKAVCPGEPGAGYDGPGERVRAAV